MKGEKYNKFILIYEMNEVIIDTKDLLFNINEIKKQDESKDYTLIAVVKGNAYGLDITKYTKFLSKNGINFFAVANLQEALLLRKSEIKDKILMLTPCVDKEDTQKLINEDIILTIDSEYSAKIANDIAKEQNKKITAHIKIDTGLARYGFKYSSINEIVNTIKKCDNINFEGIYSHLSNSLASDRSFSELQYKRFVNAIDELEKDNIRFKLKHICNSSGFFKFKNMHLNCARIGSAFLGVAYGENGKLKTIGQFHTKITKIKNIDAGQTIGYGNSYKTKKPMKMAIIHTGYFDGIGLTLQDQRFKFLSKAKRVVMDLKKLIKEDASYINIDNKRYKIIGQIGMFDTIIDITGNETFKENDDIYFNVRPILIDSSIERKYI